MRGALEPPLSGRDSRTPIAPPLEQRICTEGKQCTAAASGPPTPGDKSCREEKRRRGKRASVFLRPRASSKNLGEKLGEILLARPLLINPLIGRNQAAKNGACGEKGNEGLAKIKVKGPAETGTGQQPPPELTAKGVK